MKRAGVVLLFGLGILLPGPSGVQAVGPLDSVRTVGPSGSSRITDFSPVLLWEYDGRPMRQYQLQLVPHGNDGPGIDLVRNAHCCAADNFMVQAPPAWYGMLPDITYSWRVRASAATTSVPLDDPSWTLWSEWVRFKTPTVTSGRISAKQPGNGDRFTARNLPPLIWNDVQQDVFYYEVQLSLDESFDTDPTTATAAVYWNLIHGGVSTPPNSWAPPTSLTVERNRTYFWRVRPRVQGDGTPLQWSTTFRFHVLP